MRLATLLLCLVPLAAQANDGFGGLTATGLTFGQTEAVAMEEEDLFLSMDQVRVRYVFRNLTAADVTGEVIFPLPPISLAQMQMSEFNLPPDRGAENLVNFTARVQGQPVAVAIDRIAVIEPPWDETRPASAQYDSPGRDVTADLARFGLPLTTDSDLVVEHLARLSPEVQAQLAAAGLAEFWPASEGSDLPVDALPLWSVVLRYHWTQTFPAGAQLTVEHSYENHPPGGLFGWQDPPTEDYLAPIAARYCIDAGTSRALARALRRQDEGGEPYAMGISHDLSYVLRTANSWAGPIGRFRLTLDKGAPENVLSLCAEGVEKTGPTTFVIEKRNYSPEADLNVLIAAPIHD